MKNSNLFNEIIYLKNYTLSEKFAICFLGSLLLTTATLLIFALFTIGAEVTGFSLAGFFPVIFYIDTEKGGGDRKQKILQTKALFNQNCSLWFTDICITGGQLIKESRKDLKVKNSYYGNDEESTIHRITMVSVKSQQDMDIIINGVGNIWGGDAMQLNTIKRVLEPTEKGNILGVQIQGNWATYKQLLEFNEKAKAEQEKKVQEVEKSIVNKANKSEDINHSKVMEDYEKELKKKSK
tara:strand:- start:417 stop:1130 length:714 start_codon:yes stop_codon:yes gene_type:complete